MKRVIRSSCEISSASKAQQSAKISKLLQKAGSALEAYSNIDYSVSDNGTIITYRRDGQGQIFTQSVDLIYVPHYKVTNLEGRYVGEATSDDELIDLICTLIKSDLDLI